ncbi:hypothetical protein SBA1_500045 [Candidatus Sulfotelmatobacter kueseliae]|uniref:Polysaccharide chain length determinant N-terminal domain-containing protein n=1 Tax=Candidatus Sulfotelmatobacter kueseliae TaxID=2042962 RepID=A0A2U3KW40_9BACT|nr:hypothetical protein SBA1_500045 [Candidatus Sulfotelmatobacter kueseliae]
MNDHAWPDEDKATSHFTLRDLLLVVFRHKRWVNLCFFGLLTGTMLAALFVIPLYYKSMVIFLVERERGNPVVTPEQISQTVNENQAITEQDVNSEIGLLQADAVLRQVVISSGLDKRKTLIGSVMENLFGPTDPQKRIERAMKKLSSDLKIEPEKKSSLIDVSYKSKDPQLATLVLRSLTDAYMREHFAAHTAPGQVPFFEQEVQRYKKELDDAEAAAKQFSEQENGVAPQVDRDITLQRLGDFNLTLQQARADMAEAGERVRTLEKEAGVTPERLTTSLRNSDDAPVLQGLKNTLMNLEIKRTELLTKYQPTYPLVQEVDKQIAETQSSIATEESQPIKEQTTDVNPTYAWVDEELAKAKAQYSGLQARVEAQQAMVAKYEAKIHDLERKQLTHQDVQRALKASEQNYLLNLQKLEQAKMTDALDTTRIANVSVVQPASSPMLPWNPRGLMALIGVLLSIMLTGGGLYVRERRDPSFRTPAEVAADLDVPLLAAVPHRFNGFAMNGNGLQANGNGHGNGNESWQETNSRSESRPNSIISRTR